MLSEYFVTRNYSIITKTHYKVQIIKKLRRKVRSTEQTNICSFYLLFNMEKLFETFSS